MLPITSLATMALLRLWELRRVSELLSQYASKKSNCAFQQHGLDTHFDSLKTLLDNFVKDKTTRDCQDNYLLPSGSEALSQILRA